MKLIIFSLTTFDVVIFTDIEMQTYPVDRPLTRTTVARL